VISIVNMIPAAQMAAIVAMTAAQTAALTAKAITRPRRRSRIMGLGGLRSGVLREGLTRLGDLYGHRVEDRKSDV
jgi:hypothetical protein